MYVGLIDGWFAQLRDLAQKTQEGPLRIGLDLKIRPSSVQKKQQANALNLGKYLVKSDQLNSYSSCLN